MDDSHFIEITKLENRKTLGIMAKSTLLQNGADFGLQIGTH